MKNYRIHSCLRPLQKGWRPIWLINSAGALSLLLGACSFTPQETGTALTPPAAWKTAAPQAGWVNADQARVWKAGRWWALFGDAQLDALMPQVEVSNQNLAQAVANVAQAQALLRQQQAALWPTVGASASANRAGGQDTATTHSGSVGLNVSWAPDLWGKLGDAARAQGASVQASQADLAAARLSAQGSLAQAWFALREADAEMALMDDIITGYERSAKITQNRYDAGIAARTAALQAQSTLENARASRVALQRSRALSEHAIALLVGHAPADFSLPVAPWIDTVPAIPAGVPAELLLRRPDVAATERAVAAANARIGVARSAYFPQLTLSGGIVSDGLEDGRVVSGVGGQYNFVSMAHALQDGRLVMMLRSCRVKDGQAVSNIVWNYGHMTIPRILRDIVVTEYGIANLRSKSDKDIIAALLNVADSRFQAELLAKAKAAGKIPADYEIPERYRNNVPEALEAKFRAYRAAGFFPPYPFGNDFSDEEMILARALKGLKAKMGRKVGTMSGGILNVIKGGEVPARALPYLRRMKLDNPVTFKDKVVQSLLISELIESGHA